MVVRSFRPEDFDAFFACYHRGFPDGHNRYSLARLVRFFPETSFLAEENGQIVGVVIAITEFSKAWLTALTVKPAQSKRQTRRIFMELLAALGEKLVELGYNEVFFTTSRRSLVRMALKLGGNAVSKEANYYFDGKDRHILQVPSASLDRLQKQRTATC